MKINWKTYYRIIVIFFVSCALFTLVLFLPIADIVKNIISVPAAAALIAALYKILMDESRFIKEQIVQKEERIHALSTSSHMAIVAFDKHVEFSEKYLNVMKKGLIELWSKGPCKEALDLAEKLKETRLDYAAWITKDIRVSLFPFEQALAKIGVNEQLLVNVPVGDERSAMVSETYSLFSQAMDIKKDTPEKEIGVSQVIEKIQELLGINELAKLRRQVIKEANKALEAKA